MFQLNTISNVTNEFYIDKSLLDNFMQSQTKVHKPSDIHVLEVMTSSSVPDNDEPREIRIEATRESAS